MWSHVNSRNYQWDFQWNDGNKSMKINKGKVVQEKRDIFAAFLIGIVNLNNPKFSLFAVLGKKQAYATLEILKKERIR